MLHYPHSEKSDGNQVLQDLRAFVLQKNYPCVAAIKSVRQNQYMVGVYEDFGSARFSRDLRADLILFLNEQRKTNSTYLTFFAVFSGETQFSEDDFQKNLWNELSHLTSIEKKQNDWGSLNTSDPLQPGFSLSIEGQAFFVVGLYGQSPRWARQFALPTLVFNTMNQFENLARSGEYEPMKKAIRKRDIQFQGSVNPMVEKYGDDWESIQFSGNSNPPHWKCPFHFFKESEK